MQPIIVRPACRGCEARVQAMSRAILLSLDEGQAIAQCLKAKVSVSAIEGLVGGGVRLVCRSTAGAEIIREALKKHLIHGEAVRERHRPPTPLW